MLIIIIIIIITIIIIIIIIINIIAKMSEHFLNSVFQQNTCFSREIMAATFVS